MPGAQVASQEKGATRANAWTIFWIPTITLLILVVERLSALVHFARALHLPGGWSFWLSPVAGFVAWFGFWAWGLLTGRIVPRPVLERATARIDELERELADAHSVFAAFLHGPKE